MTTPETLLRKWLETHQRTNANRELIEETEKWLGDLGRDRPEQRATNPFEQLRAWCNTKSRELPIEEGMCAYGLPEQSPSPISDARHKCLETSQDAKLTRDEIDDGWHWCNEFDGLLVGPGMGELDCCHCLPSNHKAYWYRIGRDWLEDSSLEKWFPITAEQLTTQSTRIRELEAALAEAQKDSARLEWMELACGGFVRGTNIPLWSIQGDDSPFEDQDIRQAIDNESKRLGGCTTT